METCESVSIIRFTKHLQVHTSCRKLIHNEHMSDIANKIIDWAPAHTITIIFFFIHLLLLLFFLYSIFTKKIAHCTIFMGSSLICLLPPFFSIHFFYLFIWLHIWCICILKKKKQSAFSNNTYFAIRIFNETKEKEKYYSNSFICFTCSWINTTFSNWKRWYHIEISSVVMKNHTQRERERKSNA